MLKQYYDTYVDEYRHAIIKMFMHEPIESIFFAEGTAQQAKNWFFQWAVIYIVGKKIERFQNE
jgi:hypothetical protein